MVFDMIIQLISSGVGWVAVVALAYFLFTLWHDAKNALRD